MQDYKPLCATVKICATLVDPKFDFYILTPVTLKVGQTTGEYVSWCVCVSADLVIVG